MKPLVTLKQKNKIRGSHTLKASNWGKCRQRKEGKQTCKF